MSESDVRSAATRPPSELVASMVEQVPAAVVITDLGGHVQYWNPHAELVFGWTGLEAAGRRFADLVVPSFMRQRAAAIRRDDTRASALAGRAQTRSSERPHIPGDAHQNRHL